MNSFEIGQYKTEMMYELLSDPEIVSLLDPDKEFSYPDELVYERIFNYGRVPMTEQETKAYLTLTADVDNLMKNNKLIRNVRLTVRAISHANIMKVPGKSINRVDLLSACVDRVLNGSYKFGIGPLEIASNDEYTLDEQHFYREIVFKTTGVNVPACR